MKPPFPEPFGRHAPREETPGFSLGRLVGLLLLSFVCSALRVIGANGSEPYEPVYVDPLTEPWRLRTFPELNGLGAQCVAEGRDGAMWFGTLDGVWSYDGFDWVRHTGPGVPGKGDARFQPIHVDDVAGVFSAALGDEGTRGKVLEIAGPEILTYREMLAAVADELAVRKPMVNVPIPLIRMGAWVMDLLPLLEPPVTNEQLKMLQIDNTTAHNAAPELLGRPLRSLRGNLDFLRNAR